jgi:hypothetical protein
MPIFAASNTSEEDFQYRALITQYYDYVNQGEHENVANLYGNALENYVSPFFDDVNNSQEHAGLYNVESVNISSITLVDSQSNSYSFEDENYTYVNTYFVKCDMDVYSPDKYYTDGYNYFTFYIGMDSNDNLKIANIEIPFYKTINEYDTNSLDVMQYQTKRNTYLYGQQNMVNGLIQPMEMPLYIDYVHNPSTIRVDLSYSNTNDSPVSVAFETYCYSVASEEINTLSNLNGARAAAMALKMFAIYKVSSAGSGTNFDIYGDSYGQNYNPNYQEEDISNIAEQAVLDIYGYFLLDHYGAYFLTPYRTQASNNSHCQQYGGILPQIEANTMGVNGSDWRSILRYYYTKNASVSHYLGSNMNSGTLVFTTTHLHNWGSGGTCTYCGAED